MKNDTHLPMHPVIFRDRGAGKDFFCSSTAVSEEKETVDGVEYFVIPVEVSSASHPFYTGQENIIDSAGRVEKFKSRAGKKASGGKKQRRSRTAVSEDISSAVDSAEAVSTKEVVPEDADTADSAEQTETQQ